MSEHVSLGRSYRVADELNRGIPSREIAEAAGSALAIETPLFRQPDDMAGPLRGQSSRQAPKWLHRRRDSVGERDQAD